MPVLYATKPFKLHGIPVVIGQRLTVSSIMERRILAAGVASRAAPAPAKTEKPKAKKAKAKKAKGGKNEAAE